MASAEPKKARPLMPEFGESHVMGDRPSAGCPGGSSCGAGCSCRCRVRGRSRLFCPGCAAGLEDGRFFDILQGHAGRQVDVIAVGDEVLRKVLEPNEVVPAEDERMLDRVFQLAHVARPVVEHDGGYRLPGDARHAASFLMVEPLDEMIHQQGDVLRRSDSGGRRILNTLMRK